MDDYGSITFAGEYAEGILLVAEEYFEEAFADAEPGPDLDFLGRWCHTCGPGGARPRMGATAVWRDALWEPEICWNHASDLSL